MASFISTPGHGYLKVTLRELRKALEAGYKPTNFSLMNGEHALLEEDVDAFAYVKAIGEDEDWYGSLKTKYRRRNIDWKHFVTVANDIKELDRWLDVVRRRRNLGEGAEVIVFDKPYVVMKRRKSGNKVEYLLSGDQIGWAKSSDIEGIRNG